MSDSTPVRVRYAPSPTGFLHVGGARTALYNYLLAQQTGGQFILRIEDTDQSRFNPDSLADLMAGLRFLGLDWDEGPEKGGDFGPYYQTERRDIYHKHLQPLLDEGKVYRCFCSAERLASINEERRKAGLPTGYDRHCRNLDPAEAEKRAAEGESHVIRLKVPLEGSVTGTDFLRGEITVENSTLQDAVLLKSDGLPTYAFAAMVDDHLMEITHVLRGEEWISSFPLHLHVLDALGWEPPHFVHLPVILNPSGKGKMSKRESRAPDGSIQPVFVHSFAEMGYLPDALANFMALVGWSYDGQTEIMSREALIERFSLERVNTSPAAWDYDKLNHFNSVYLRDLSPAEFAERALPFLKNAGYSADLDTLTRIAPHVQERVSILSELPELVDFFFQPDLPAYDLSLLVPRKMELADVPPILQKAQVILSEVDFEASVMEVAIKAAIKEMGIKVGQMFQPLRVATCGKKSGPPLFDSLEILGREMVLARLVKAIERIEAEG